MADGEPLFRREALADRRDHRPGTAAALPAMSPWIERWFWLLVVMVAALVTSGFLVRVDVSTEAKVRVDPVSGTAEALIPASQAHRLASGALLRVDSGGSRTSALRVWSWRPLAAAPERSGLAVGCGVVPDTVRWTLVDGKAEACAGCSGIVSGGDGADGRVCLDVTIRLGTERLLTYLLMA